IRRLNQGKLVRPYARGIDRIKHVYGQLPFEYTIASRSTDVMVMALQCLKHKPFGFQPIFPAPPADSTAQVLAQWNAVYDALMRLLVLCSKV
ncbi:hypothetical protein Tco_0143315, partial [Tanacetum coccineum]